MAKYDDALRGYAYSVMKRDNFICRYCGLNGRESFANWLTLSWDHLLPKDDTRREDQNYIVTACQFCNNADNMYFRHAANRGLRFDGLSQDELVDQRRPYVMKTRRSYQGFWNENVRK